MPNQPLHVLVLTSLPDALLQRIAGISPGLRVADGAALLLQELPAALRPGQEPAPLRTDRSLNGLLAEAEVILAPRRVPRDLAARAPRLRWLQWPMAGADALLDTDVWSKPSVAITSASGINARPVAEWVLMAALALMKDLPRMLEAKALRRWDRYPLGQLQGKTMGIVGYGAVGREVATLARAFGMEVLATKRTIHPIAPGWLLPQAKLPRLLAESHIVALCVPATPQTESLISPRELARMRPGAILINASRGGVVDEPALIEALRSGRLAGAALDVFQREPLPLDTPYGPCQTSSSAPTSPTSFLSMTPASLISSLKTSAVTWPASPSSTSSTAARATDEGTALLV
jgi:phosphoglycerate dehydrogenase-like enzyme